MERRIRVRKEKLPIHLKISVFMYIITDYLARMRKKRIAKYVKNLIKYLVEVDLPFLPIIAVLVLIVLLPAIPYILIALAVKYLFL